MGTWYFDLAQQVADRLRNTDKIAVFAMGYGASGLPHSGTIAEVIRMNMVRKAYEHITGKPSIFLAIIDDLDGLRKVPGNVPNKAMLQANLGKSVSHIPSPFHDAAAMGSSDGSTTVAGSSHNAALAAESSHGATTVAGSSRRATTGSSHDAAAIGSSHGTAAGAGPSHESAAGVESFAEYNIKRFVHLLEKFDYCVVPVSDPHNIQPSDAIQLLRSSVAYRMGVFNPGLIDLLKYRTQVLQIMQEHLRQERFSTYSHFMPITDTGYVVAEGVQSYDDSGVSYIHPDTGELVHTGVVDGRCKLQWKVDFGMRWHILRVDCELYGKDLESTVEIAEQITTLLGSKPPISFMYEHFLAADGGKVSKSKGNETVFLDDWKKYTPDGTLEYMLSLNPRRSRRLDITDLPMFAEQYINNRSSIELILQQQTEHKRDELDHTHHPVSYKLALGLACALHPKNAQDLQRKMSCHTALDKQIVDRAYAYYCDHVKSTLKLEVLPQELHDPVRKLIQLLQASDDYQNCFFQVAKDYGLNVEYWFTSLYRALIGDSKGPKLGSFCAEYGVANVITRLEAACQ